MKMLCSRLLVLLMLSCLASGAVLVGVNDHFLWRGPADQNVAVSWVQTSNAQLLRSDVNWASLEPSKGNYSQHYVAVVDNVLANYTQLGVRVLLMLGTSPPWANGNQSIWAPPLDVTDFANFCEFVVRRWGAQIDSIEVRHENEQHERAKEESYERHFFFLLFRLFSFLCRFGTNHLIKRSGWPITPKTLLPDRPTLLSFRLLLRIIMFSFSK